jgi:hypothetical protein
MKLLMTFILASTLLALPTQSTKAWVAYGRAGYAHVGYARPGYGCCYHAGYSCGGVSTGTAMAAGMAGLAVGAAVARANTPVYNSYYVAPPPVVVPPSAPIGSVYSSLPYGYQPAYINGVQYYVFGGTYYRSYWGGNGVYYTVVPNPI